jgi:hypothetical protein
LPLPHAEAVQQKIRDAGALRLLAGAAEGTCQVLSCSNE